jgi:hypothetical protein
MDPVLLNSVLAASPIDRAYSHERGLAGRGRAVVRGKTAAE